MIMRGLWLLLLELSSAMLVIDIMIDRDDACNCNCECALIFRLTYSVFLYATCLPNARLEQFSLVSWCGPSLEVVRVRVSLSLVKRRELQLIAAFQLEFIGVEAHAGVAAGKSRSALQGSET